MLPSVKYDTTKGGSMESLDFNEEKAVQEGGKELEEEKADFEKAADKERARTDHTTATPTELAGGAAGDVPGHDAGPAEV
jgi:hypothetical protein